MESQDLASRLAALGLETGPSHAERKLPRIIKAGMIVRGGDLGPEGKTIEAPPPIYPEGYIPPDEAHQLAQGILADAAAEAERIVAQARVQGQQEGYQAGLAAGHQAGLESWSQLLAALKREIEGILSARQQMLAEGEPDIVRLVLLAASKVIQRDSRHPELAGEIVRRTLPRASEGTLVRIRLNPFDHGRVQATPVVTTLKATYELVVDETIGLGGCIVETTLCTIDASFRLMFEEVAKELIGDDPRTEPLVATEIDLLARSPEGSPPGCDARE